MKRKMITIDEDLCNGCGNCIAACAEGALELIDGKARVVKEQFCDGFGDCIGDCPTGALKIEELEVAAFDLEAVRTHLRSTQGEAAVARMEEANHAHAAGEHPVPPTPPPRTPPSGGCPSLRTRFAPSSAGSAPASATAAPGASGPLQAHRSDLEQWPVQIHLVQPGAPFFKGRELVVLSTCAPVASADVHWRFLRGRSVAVGCPKLDRTEGYAEKLGAILEESSIPKVIVVRMEVPCCGGLTVLVAEAVRLSKRTDLEVEEVVVGVNGDIKDIKVLTKGL